MLAGLPPAARGQVAAQPNVLIVVTDDQRAGTVHRYMPIVRSELGGRGTTFVNAVVTTPLCCPSRASILTGNYAHTHGVYGNRAETGFGAFDDTSTLATWMRGGGYRTALIGKYLNGYGDVHPDGAYVPPGWDRWFAFVEPGYFGYSVSDNGSRVAFGESPKEYSTDVLAAQAQAFIRNSDAPFFLLFAPNAPHEPFTPAPRHVDAFTDLPPHRPPSYNERRVEDKPLWVRRRPQFSLDERARMDDLRERQLESLLSVDDAVGALLQTLEETGELSDTIVVFTSDNGFQWGEHRIWGKNVPYRDTHQVPLIVRYGGVVPSGEVDRTLVANIDIAPTVAELASVPTPPVDGLSLAPLFSPGGEIPRARVLIEHGEGGPAPPLCAVRNAIEFYVRYATGEEEFYRYDLDPHELDNAAASPEAASRVKALRNGARRLCDPLPPGMEW